MTQPAKSQEPSMEEILASIRRIIADDDATKSAQRLPEPPRAESLAPPPSSYSAPAVVPRARAEPEFHAEEENAPEAAASEADQSSDILDLTESMATAVPQPQANSAARAMPQPASQFRTIDGASDIGFDEGPERPAAPSAMPPPREDRDRLISNETSAAVDSAFSALAQTVLVQNARTLEDLVREMLRPMLKSWLDDNLPGLVERLVRTEIERVSRGRAS